MKSGLILEGGAMRGMFTAGVLDILMEHDVVFDGVIGVSAGAVFGCNYKSRQIGRTIRYNAKYCNDPRYCSIRSLLKTGDLYGNQFCYHEIPEKLDIFDTKAFEQNPVEFYVVCTDIDTGKPVYHKIDRMNDTEMDWLRASASMPLVSKPVEVDGKRLLDGGITDAIPLRYFENIGFIRNVVILTQPAGYAKADSRSLPLIRLAMRGMPNTATAMQNRARRYNQTLRYIAEREKAGEILVIRPPHKLPVNHVEHDPEKLKETYEIGRKTGEQSLQQIVEFLR